MPVLLPFAVVVVERGVKVVPPLVFSVPIVQGSDAGVSRSEDCFDGKIAWITSSARRCQHTRVRGIGMAEDTQGGMQVSKGLYAFY